MLTYRPDRFKDIAETQIATDIWHWLQEPPQVLIMVTACRLRRPPVEAIGHPLAEVFPAARYQLRIRQMVGHMIRQIMIDRGLRPVRSNVRILTDDTIFRRGSTFSA
ncbi:MAG: hypothetical protein AAF631_01345 [Pseudomonadota bacterium]